MAERLPPQNLEAEKSVLGAVMLDKDAIIKIADTLSPEDFYKGSHQKIYQAMLNLYQKREAIDVLTLSSYLKEKKLLEEIGGFSYLTSLATSVPNAAHIEHYANLVREKSVLRKLLNSFSKISEEIFSTDKETEEIIDKTQQEIFQIVQQGVEMKFKPLKDDLKDAFERIEKLYKGDRSLRGLTTGFPDLDERLSGLQKANLIVLAARPSLGKTTFALDIARAVALKENQPVGIFSLEMSREDIVDRLISAQAGIDLWRLRTGRLQDESDFKLIEVALDKLSRADVFIEDSSSLDVLQIRTMARKLQLEKGLSLLIIDYLQLIRPSRRIESEVQQMTEISRGLKSLAKELNVPVLAISQLSRAVEQREIRIPRLADLRSSGSIEQDADVVLFIYRKDKDKNPETLGPEDINTAEIIIAKHRNGPTGSVKLKFNPGTVSFQSIDQQYQEIEEMEGEEAII